MSFYRGSKRIASYLEQMDISSPLGVLAHLPRRYDSYLLTPLEHLLHLQDKEKVVIYGKLVEPPHTLRFPKATSTQFYLESSNGQQFKIIAWNRPYLSKILAESVYFTVRASYDESYHALNLLSLKKGKIAPDEAFVPCYSLPSGFQEHLFRRLVKECFDSLKGQIKDDVPLSYREKYCLLSKEEALHRCHFPACYDDIRQGRRTLKYEEALLFSLKNALIRKQNQSYQAVEKGKVDRPALRTFVHRLPYSLTSCQKKAIAEALDDMEKPNLMYRLLQGDVGSGKTLVASLLMFANATRHSQSAIMAPTETLAKQHYENLKEFFASTPYKVVLLYGEQKVSERKEALKLISSGEASIVVGTHSLFSNDVKYASLGFAVIDEQHKFGVNQRALLQEKGDYCDLLLMSATPIPRTLSLSLYGDLDVSILDSFPCGEKHIDTRALPLSSKLPFKAAKKALEAGKQVYVVAPQIEGEGLTSVKNVFALFEGEFPDKAVMLHGGMSEEEKEKAISAFKSKLRPILVSTSVIEVGIDTKGAALMIIYEASHFALSSLHQLRGRIGRDGLGALCLLLDDQKDENAATKLAVMTSTLDGFKIAEEDLKMRGPGSWAGIKQSGLPDFLFLNLLDDVSILSCAKSDAKEILSHPKEEGNSSLIREARLSLNGISLA
jgi:ATP-dependent DNA helicase RecG